MSKEIEDVTCLDFLYKYIREQEHRIKEIVKDLRDHCCCVNLRNPNDHSKYAQYKKHSGHCSKCKWANYLEMPILQDY